MVRLVLDEGKTVTRVARDIDVLGTRWQRDEGAQTGGRNQGYLGDLAQQNLAPDLSSSYDRQE